MEKKSILEELRSLEAMAAESRKHMDDLVSDLSKISERMNEASKLLSSPSSSTTLVGVNTKPSPLRRKSGTMVGLKRDPEPRRKSGTMVGVSNPKSTTPVDSQ